MILLKSREELAVMRKASRIVAEILAELRKRVAPGVTTDELDALAERMTLERGARARHSRVTAPRGVTYPKTLCVSVNEEIVHGIPSSAQNQARAILLAWTLAWCTMGFFGDAAITVAVGKVSAAPSN